MSTIISLTFLDELFGPNLPSHLATHNERTHTTNFIHIPVPVDNSLTGR